MFLLLNVKSPKETGAMKGKKGTVSGAVPFNDHTISAYRKMAKHVDKIDDYYARPISWTKLRACPLVQRDSVQTWYRLTFEKYRNHR